MEKKKDIHINMYKTLIAQEAAGSAYDVYESSEHDVLEKIVHKVVKEKG